MTLLEKIDEYRALLDRKDELADATKANNADVQKCRDELAEMMLNEETPKISRDGFSYSLQAKTRYSKAAGMDDQLMQTLREFGLGDLIKETVNAQTLQGAMSNLAEENDDQLPEDFEGLINTYSFYDVSKRRERVAKKI